LNGIRHPGVAFSVRLEAEREIRHFKLVLNLLYSRIFL
jgi:hypothetical protein